MDKLTATKKLQSKRGVTIVLSIAFLIMFVSACQKDGVYKPYKKLSKITIETYVPREISWNWDGDLLKSITINNSNVNHYYFQFDYEGQRVKTIICSEDTGAPDRYYHFHYNGKLLSCIEGFQDTNNEDFPQRPCAQYSFKHNEREQIVKIQVEDYGINKSDRDPLTEILPLVMPGISLADAEKMFQAQNELPTSKQYRKTEITLDYEGDNVNVYRIEESDESYVYQYQYTRYLDPLYRFFSCNWTNYLWPLTSGYSRNLPSSVDIQRTLHLGGYDDVLNFQREYRYQIGEDDYVVESQCIDSEEGGHVTTYRYEYVKN